MTATVSKTPKPWEAKKAPEKLPPLCEMGEYVLWTPDFDSPEHEAALAVVVGNPPGSDCLDLAIYCPGSANMLPRAGVPQAVKANRERIGNIGQGCWRKRPSAPEALAGRVAELEKQLKETQDLVIAAGKELARVRSMAMNMAKKLKLESPEPPSDEGSASAA